MSETKSSDTSATATVGSGTGDMSERPPAVFPLGEAPEGRAAHGMIVPPARPNRLKMTCIEDGAAPGAKHPHYHADARVQARRSESWEVYRHRPVELQKRVFDLRGVTTGCIVHALTVRSKDGIADVDENLDQPQRRQARRLLPLRSALRDVSSVRREVRAAMKPPTVAPVSALNNEPAMDAITVPSIVRSSYLTVRNDYGIRQAASVKVQETIMPNAHPSNPAPTVPTSSRQPLRTAPPGDEPGPPATKQRSAAAPLRHSATDRPTTTTGPDPCRTPPHITDTNTVVFT